MCCVMGSHGLALAATAMAVSGTVVLIALCRNKPLLFHSLFTPLDGINPPSQSRNLRPCISSEKRKRERARNKSKKRVHFADEVAELELDKKADNEVKLVHYSRNRQVEETQIGRISRMPANRAALYNGILRDRLQRVASSY
ncbi:uncharacterized protein [Typha angustifolia]|uniref:uncharacterized protein n=1 Tax=Typha angustifolia TaxID=59011 RepID=UPI003C2EAECB